MSLTDLDRFEAACVYPGKLDELAVERELAAFLQALGVRRRVVRLRAAWRTLDDPPRNRDIEWILAECVSRRVGTRAVLTCRSLLARNFRTGVNHHADRHFRADVRRHARAGTAALELRDAGAAADALALRANLPAAELARAGNGSDMSLADHALIGVIYGAFPAVISGGAFATNPSTATGVIAFFAVFLAIGGLFSRARLVGALAALATLALGVGAGAALAMLGVHPGTTLAILVVLIGPTAIIALALNAFGTFEDPALAPVTRGNPGARASRAGWGSVWEISWTVCALFGAVDRRRPADKVWLGPLFEAFACGCWLLYWTNDTLYWLAKPTVHREPGTQRLHHDTHAALESDFVNLYFWHGVMVPAFVVQRPDLITLAHIEEEINAEVRRVMIERYRHGEEIHGAAAFIRDAGGERLDHDERYGTLWRRRIRGNQSVPGDESIVMVEVVNRSREPDGRFKHYWLRVPPTTRTAREAVAWTFNMGARQYAPEKET